MGTSVDLPKLASNTLGAVVIARVAASFHNLQAKHARSLPVLSSILHPHRLGQELEIFTDLSLTLSAGIEATRIYQSPMPLHLAYSGS